MDLPHGNYSSVYGDKLGDSFSSSFIFSNKIFCNNHALVDNREKQGDGGRK